MTESERRELAALRHQVVSLTHEVLRNREDIANLRAGTAAMQAALMSLTARAAALSGDWRDFIDILQTSAATTIDASLEGAMRAKAQQHAAEIFQDIRAGLLAIDQDDV